MLQRNGGKAGQNPILCLDKLPPTMTFSMKSEFDSGIFFPFPSFWEYFSAGTVAPKNLVCFFFNLAVGFIPPTTLEISKVCYKA